MACHITATRQRVTTKHPKIETYYNASRRMRSHPRLQAQRGFNS
uniref:Uncharacterized protein n=1 Tax=Anguilla anguilla TaxID=7936 RepID=A0A0E9PDR2_ANGAN